MRYRLILCLLLGAICFSCIQDEPLNPEADILFFELPEEVALSPATFNQEKITVIVRHNVELTSLIPTLEITEGATISPDASTPRDFSSPVTYTVTAADGVHQRIYTVQAMRPPRYQFSFEEWKALSGFATYEIPVEYNEDGTAYYPWDSSNKGIAIYQKYPTAEEYPIHATTSHSDGSFGAEMITLKGPGSILGVLNIPVVAGSLFTGVLNPLNAMINPLLATQFGQPFDEKPLRFKGHYQYKPGSGDYINPKGEVVPGAKDTCAVYSVFFKTDKSVQKLDGTNILTHPNIIAVAIMPDEMRAGSPGDDFVPFDIPFVYRTDEPLDFENNSYKLAIIFSSSFNGDRYEGAPGSRLIIDQVTIVTDKQNEL